MLATQVMLDGFLGFSPTGDGVRIDLKLPEEWPELTIDRIHVKEMVLRVTAREGEIELWLEEARRNERFFVQLPDGDWRMVFIDKDGEEREMEARRREGDGAYEVRWEGAVGVRFLR